MADHPTLLAVGAALLQACTVLVERFKTLDNEAHRAARADKRARLLTTAPDRPPSRARRQGGGFWPPLTAVAHIAGEEFGRGEKTAGQPNQKTRKECYFGGPRPKGLTQESPLQKHVIIGLSAVATCENV